MATISSPITASKFTESFYDVSIAFLIINLDKSKFIWIGNAANAEMNSLVAAVTTRMVSLEVYILVYNTISVRISRRRC